jgi:hypothetical protein
MNGRITPCVFALSNAAADEILFDVGFSLTAVVCCRLNEFGSASKLGGPMMPPFVFFKNR